MSKITRIKKIYPVQFNKNKPKNTNASFANILKKIMNTDATDNTVNNQPQAYYVRSDEINNLQILMNDFEYKKYINTIYQDIFK